jgi:hypothetical protein
MNLLIYNIISFTLAPACLDKAFRYKANATLALERIIIVIHAFEDEVG